ncbi:MAG TPA: hypothetical protein PKK10_15045 [Woeseiaceae bacterium]|nr:hypothetical protein [Woeseiaceae bacterium]
MKWIVAILVLGAVGYGAAKAYLHHNVGNGVDNAVIMMSPYVQVEYEGISSTLAGELTMDGVRARIAGLHDEIYIEKIGIVTSSFLSLMELGDMASKRGSSSPDLPDSFGFLVSGVHIPSNSDVYRKVYEMRLEALGVDDHELPAASCVGKYGFSPSALAGLGYREQVISAAATFHNNKDSFSMEINTSTADMWDMRMNIVMDGDMRTELSKGTAYRPALRNFKLQFTDLGLNQRIEKYCAEQGMSTEETTQAQLEALTWFGESNGIVFDEYMIDPYLEFFNGKSTIVITAAPREPLRVSQIGLYNPKDVPALLNLSATTL